MADTTFKASQAGHLVLKEAQPLNFESWPVIRRFESWKQQFYREVAAKSGGNPRDTMAWVKEIEAKTNIIDLSSSISTSGYNYESLDFKIAAGLWKILKGDFEKRLQNEERTNQLTDPNYMMTGRQVAYRIFEHLLCQNRESKSSTSTTCSP